MKINSVGGPQGPHKKKEKKMRKTIEQMLNRAGRNNYGYCEVSPGTDMARRLSHLTESAIATMIKRGYLKKVGTGLILTPEGYGAK